MNTTERAFVIDKQLQRLLLSGEGEVINEVTEALDGKDGYALSMQAIVSAIVYPDLAQSKKTLCRVNTSVKYVNWYRLILANYTSMQSAAQVAASSVQSDKVLIERQGRGFSLKVTQEALVSKDAFLIVSLDDVTCETLEKGIFLHCVWEQKFHVIPFGASTKHKFQALINKQDKAFSAIVNSESHLYLT